MRKRGLPRSRADIQDLVESDDGPAQFLPALREIVHAGWSSGDNAAPTILLAIDQGEELFSEDGRDEAKRFIEILTRTLTADPRTLAVLVMRSDAFPQVQGDPSLAALPKETFALDRMLEGSYRAVIEGPARLVEPPLKIDPLLADALLEDISGQDALPLLAFTLAHLYDNSRADNELTLADYEKIGRIKGVIAKTVAQAFAEAAERREAPKDAKAQFALARSAFIPHLAQINAAGQVARRVATRENIPLKARRLIDRFVRHRLLIKDRRKDVEVVEVAHEALLRQPPFSDWLEDDREFLVWRDRLSQARVAFETEKRGLLVDLELAVARGYERSRAQGEIEPADLAFIRDSIAGEEERQLRREATEREEQERRIRDAERFGEEQKKALANLHEAQLAQSRFLVAQSRFLADQARQRLEADDVGTAVLLALEALADTAAGSDRPYLPGAELQIDRAWRALRERLVLGHDDVVSSATFSRDGKRILTSSFDKTARIWDAATGKPIGEPLKGHDGKVWSAAFSPADKRIVTASDDNTARLWDAATAKPIGEPLRGHAETVKSAAFSLDGKLIVTASSDNTAHVWDAAAAKAIGELKGHGGAVNSAAFSPDGKRTSPHPAT
jgi:WD domain, G-beta repeat